MKSPALLSASLLVLLTLGAARAVPVQFNAGQNLQDFIGYGRGALRGVFDSATGEQIMLGARGGTSAIGNRAFGAAVGAGRLIGWQGGLAVSTGLIGAALAWYMGQAQGAIDQGSPGLAGLRDTPRPAAGVRNHGYCNWSPFYPYGPGNYVMNCYDGAGEIGGTFFGPGAIVATFKAITRPRYPGDIPTSQTGDSENGTLTFGIQLPPGAPITPGNLYDGYTDPATGIVHPPNPNIPEELRNIANEFLKSHPPSAGELASGTFAPGVTISPAPNPNQSAGGPVDPSIDTDGDGVPDGYELEHGSDPSDPASVPRDAPRIVGRETTTTNNPDGSVTTTTTTTYSDNSSSSNSTTTTTTTTNNTTNNTTTTTTTTTITYIERGPNGVPRGEPKIETKTERETRPNPNPVPTDENACRAAGGTWANGACTPKKEPCPVGFTANASGSCVQDKEKDPGDACGDFSLGRALYHPGTYLRDVFVPCEALSDLIGPSLALLKTKFPFSLAASLNGWFAGAGSASSGGVTALPAMLGPIPLEWGWLQSLWGLIKTLVGVALWSWFIYWIIDRFTPRTEI